MNKNLELNFKFELTKAQQQKIADKISVARNSNQYYFFLANILIDDKVNLEALEKPILEGELLLGESALEAVKYLDTVLEQNQGNHSSDKT